ncbi:FMN-binding negative transcriptional regulator [Sphingomonas sp. HF-S4]|uniref:FMN-binding negative transcriptional regulator n=1 Tax=Sphingomonas agrestis TaxID=3080540 RepID=A0ABU3Y4F0_9SPHN|nr:FMN-binding negative transcriptional regulator [Sphingomonas sp. HF-S4]MDV3455982.1 FMN-binding negative transcriptional regulator [Sphingomonas sp. HF-S4]
MSRYAPRRPGDVARFVRSEMLGLVVTHDAQGYISTPLPLLAETGEDGAVHTIIGHFAKANPHVARVEANPQALISFLGPHGYIGPAAVSKPGWAPSWNYQLAQFEVEIALEPDQGDAAIRLLVDALEQDFPQPWTPEQMGERYSRLTPHVVAFRAQVIRQSARFKLGQDEDRETFREIVDALGDTPLAHAMLDQAQY